MRRETVASTGRLRGWFAVLALGLLLTACGADKPVAPSGPTTADVSGAWSGTSTYPNAPFQLTLAQAGTTLTGRYSDRLDTSMRVTGTYSSPTIYVLVDFGDGGLVMDGQMIDGRTIQGTIRSPSLGSVSYPFTMSR